MEMQSIVWFLLGVAAIFVAWMAHRSWQRRKKQRAGRNSTTGVVAAAS